MANEWDSIEILPVDDLWAHYTIGDVLGEGQYGVVWNCEERDTGLQFACKHIKLAGLGEKGLRAAVREIEVMALLYGQCNVVPLHAIFEDDESVYVLMECCTGGDLLALIQKHGRIAEVESRQLFLDVARGVKQCHDSGVIHRDIKPENILLARTAPTANPSPPASPKSPFSALPLNPLRSRANKSDFATSASAAPAVTAKLADFGLSLALRPGQQVVGYAGSFPYEAPEVLAQKPYNISADIFSLGVTLYAMLSGTWPAFHKARALDDLVDWQLPCWQHVSELAKDLIRWMLSPHGHMRPTADEVLAHPWFRVPVHLLQLQAGARSLVRGLRVGRYWRRSHLQLQPVEPKHECQEHAESPTRASPPPKRTSRHAPSSPRVPCGQELMRGSAADVNRQQRQNQQRQSVDMVGFEGCVLSVR